MEMYPNPPMDYTRHLAFLGYPGIYLMWDGDFWNDTNSEYLPWGAYPNGYRYVDIPVGAIQYREYVHRLMAVVYIANADPIRKTQVNHINGDKNCNRVNNLEWITGLDNIHHAGKLGLYPQMYITEQKAHEICGRLIDGMKSAEIARVCNVSASAVGCIKTGKTWKHISSQYEGLPCVDTRYNRFLKTPI